MSQPPRTEPLSEPLRIFVADAPRTCSQVFNKLWAAHPKLGQVFHPMMAACLYGPERLPLHLKQCAEADSALTGLAVAAEPNASCETYADAIIRLEKEIKDIEARGKIPWIKDHTVCHIDSDVIISAIRSDKERVVLRRTNPTPFPDDLFDSFTPIILIRHPALMIRSFYKTQRSIFKIDAVDEEFVAMTTLKFAQLWFDAKWKDHSSPPPIVVDAADIVENTQAVVSTICERLGIDETGVQYSWDAIPKENWPSDQIMQTFFKDVLRSSGVDRALTHNERNIDLEIITQQWTTDYGVHTATALRKRVEQEIPIYEFLKQHKI